MVNDPNTLAAQAAGVGFAPKRKPRIAWEIARLGSDFTMVSGLIKHGCPGLATGRMIQPGKRGAIKEKEPRALTKLGLDPKHWTAKVKGIGNGYWRVVAELEDLVDLAAQFKQRTLYGIGFARRLRES